MTLVLFDFLLSRNANFEKFVFNEASLDVINSHSGTHSRVLINGAKFDICALSSFGGVKAHTQTELRFIMYIKPS